MVISNSDLSSDENYRWLLTVIDKSSTSLNVTCAVNVETVAEEIPSVSIEVSPSQSGKFNIYERTQLSAEMPLEYGEISFLWQETTLSIDDVYTHPFMTVYENYLVISPLGGTTLESEGLLVGKEYCFRVDATSTSFSGTSHFETCLLSNTPPSNCACLSDLSIGESMVDSFAISCKGCVDDDIPLSFRFGKKSLTSGNIQFVTEYTQDSLYTFTALSPGNHSIYVQIKDFLGMETTETLNIMVLPPSESSSDEFLESTRDLLSAAQNGSDSSSKIVVTQVAVENIEFAASNSGDDEMIETIAESAMAITKNVLEEMTSENADMNSISQIATLSNDVLQSSSRNVKNDSVKLSIASSAVKVMKTLAFNYLNENDSIATSLTDTFLGEFHRATRFLSFFIYKT